MANKIIYLNENEAILINEQITKQRNLLRDINLLASAMSRPRQQPITQELI
jgi:hypothetical protein